MMKSPTTRLTRVLHQDGNWRRLGSSEHRVRYLRQLKMKRPTHDWLLPIMLVTLLYCSANADDQEHLLGDYLGANVSRLLADLGEPTERATQSLTYWYTPSIGGGRPAAPTAAPSAAGIVVAPQYAPLTLPPRYCKMVVAIDEEQRVRAIDLHGPTCAEYVLSLRP